MNIVLVHNPKSGDAVAPGTLRELFQKNGIVVDTVVVIDDDFKKNLRPFVDSGRLIAAVGGDGTISAAAACIAGSSATLAPLPGGTLNHFTKDLGVPQDLGDAIAALSSATPRVLDVAAVNNMVFINNSSIGLYPSSLRERDRREDKLGKWPAMIIASIRTFVRLPGFTVTIDDRTFQTPFVFVGNNRYRMDEIGLPVRDKLNEGLLTVFIAKKIARLTLLKIAFLALVGKAHVVNEFEIRTVKSLVIRTRNTRPHVSHDGEVSRLESPLHFEIRPQVLRVLC